MKNPNQPTEGEGNLHLFKYLYFSAGLEHVQNLAEQCESLPELLVLICEQQKDLKSKIQYHIEESLALESPKVLESFAFKNDNLK